MTIYVTLLGLSSERTLLMPFTKAWTVLMRVSVGDALFVNDLYIDIVKPFFCSESMKKLGLSHQVIQRVRILVQVTIYRRLLIGRDGHLDQSEAYDIS